MPPKLLTMSRAESTAPSVWDFGRKNSGSGSTSMRRADIAASSTTFLRNGRHQPLADADKAGRRKHDEGDEDEAEPEQPVLGIDAEEFAKQDEEQRTERRP